MMPRQGVSALKDLTWYLSGPMARFSGHVDRHYSVAQHCVIAGGA